MSEALRKKALSVLDNPDASERKREAAKALLSKLDSAEGAAGSSFEGDLGAAPAEPQKPEGLGDLVDKNTGGGLRSNRRGREVMRELQGEESDASNAAAWGASQATGIPGSSDELGALALEGHPLLNALLMAVNPAAPAVVGAMQSLMPGNAPRTDGRGIDAPLMSEHGRYRALQQGLQTEGAELQESSPGAYQQGELAMTAAQMAAAPLFSGATASIPAAQTGRAALARGAAAGGVGGAAAGGAMSESAAEVDPMGLLGDIAAGGGIGSLLGLLLPAVGIAGKGIYNRMKDTTKGPRAGMVRNAEAVGSEPRFTQGGMSTPDEVAALARRGEEAGVYHPHAQAADEGLDEVLGALQRKRDETVVKAIEPSTEAFYRSPASRLDEPYIMDDLVDEMAELRKALSDETLGLPRPVPGGGRAQAVGDVTDKLRVRLNKGPLDAVDALGLQDKAGVSGRIVSRGQGEFDVEGTQAIRTAKELDDWIRDLDAAAGDAAKRQSGTSKISADLAAKLREKRAALFGDEVVDLDDELLRKLGFKEKPTFGELKERHEGLLSEMGEHLRGIGLPQDTSKFTRENAAKQVASAIKGFRSSPDSVAADRALEYFNNGLAPDPAVLAAGARDMGLLQSGGMSPHMVSSGDGVKMYGAGKLKDLTNRLARLKDLHSSKAEAMATLAATGLTGLSLDAASAMLDTLYEDL